MLEKIFPERLDIYNVYRPFAKANFCADVTEHDRTEYFDKAKWKCAAEINLHALPVSKAYGGKGYNAMQTCAAYEGFGNGCENNGLAFSIGAHMLATVLPIYQYGSDEQKKNILAPLARATNVGANAITELNGGSDVFSMQTKAVKDGANYIITGSKVYITNAPVADSILVYAVTDETKGFFGGISAFILPAHQPGLRLGNAVSKMGLRTCPMSEVFFDDVVAGKEQLLGEEGGGAIMFNNSMVWERTVLSAMILGQVERVFDKTLKYCRERKIKDRPLAAHENIAHTLAWVKIVIAAARNLIYDAAWAIDNHDKDAMMKASMAKCFVAEQGVDAVKQMQAMYGASGYLTENEIEREYRDIYASLIYSGTTEIQKNIIIAYAK